MRYSGSGPGFLNWPRKTLDQFLAEGGREWVHDFAKKLLPLADPADLDDFAQDLLLWAIEHYSEFDPHQGEFRRWLGAHLWGMAHHARRTAARAIELYVGEPCDDSAILRDPTDAYLAKLEMARVSDHLSPFEPDLMHWCLRDGNTMPELRQLLARKYPKHRLPTDNSALLRRVQAVRRKLVRLLMSVEPLIAQPSTQDRGKRGAA